MREINIKPLNKVKLREFYMAVMVSAVNVALVEKLHNSLFS